VAADDEEGGEGGFFDELVEVDVHDVEACDLFELRAQRDEEQVEHEVRHAVHDVVELVTRGYHFLGGGERRVQDQALAEPGLQLLAEQQRGHCAHGAAPDEQRLEAELGAHMRDHELEVGLLLEAQRAELFPRVAVARVVEQHQTEVLDGRLEEIRAFRPVARVAVRVDQTGLGVRLVQVHRARDSLSKLTRPTRSASAARSRVA
jgi:hypothetical protein